MSSNVLSDNEVAELQARPSTELSGYRRVLLRPRERDALCATVRALLLERNGILANMTEMNQVRALDKTAWRRIGETLGLNEEESAHTSHVLAVLAERMTKYEQLQSQLAQVTQEPLAATIDILEQRRRQLGAKSIPEYARTINFLQAIVDEKKKKYPPLRAARSNHES